MDFGVCLWYWGFLFGVFGVLSAFAGAGYMLEFIAFFR
jgi:hypothetical protein